MRALTDFLLPELLKLLSDAPPVDAYVSEESESQSQSQSQSQSESQARSSGGVNAALPQTQPRVMIVRDTNPPAQTITVVDRNFAVDAFLPQQVIAAQVLKKYGHAQLSALRGSVIRIEKYHFSTPQRCEAARVKQLTSSEQARICLWVDEISVIDGGPLSANSTPHIDENARITALLQELSDDQLNMRLVVRQGLPPLSDTPHGVEQFDDNHPLEDEDCIIPEDQEAQLEAQDGWGVPTEKQKSDSQLIAENGSEPESQGLGTQLSPAPLRKTTSVRVEATEQSQEDDDESVPDSQGFHFQEENIEKAFVQCSDTESDVESSSSSDREGARKSAKVKTSQSARTTTAAGKMNGSAAQVLPSPVKSKDSPVKRRSPLKVKRKARPSQQNSQSDTDTTRDANQQLIGASQEDAAVTDPIGGDNFPQTQAQDSCEGFADADDSTADPNESQTQMSQEARTQDGGNTRQVRVAVTSSVLQTRKYGKEVIAFGELDQQREAGHLSQQPNSFDDQSQSASSSILFNAADSQYGFLTQAPDADSQNEPNATERENDNESQTEGGDSFLPMDVDVWQTQPNDESQVFGFESFGNLNSQSQNDQEHGERPSSSFVNAEPAESLQNVEEASEEPEFGAGESFEDEQENLNLHHPNQPQPESDDHQQSENLLSPKVAPKQQAGDSPKPKSSVQSDQLTAKSRDRLKPGTPTSSKSSSISDGLSQVDPARVGKESPSSAGLFSQKRSQKRPLGSVTSTGSGDPQPTTAATEAVGANSSVSKQRKALRRTEKSSPLQSGKEQALVQSTAVGVKSNRNSLFNGVPLSILQRAQQLCDDPPATTSRNNNLSTSDSGGEPRSLQTVLNQLQHVPTERPTGISSRRRDNSSNPSATFQPYIRPSKRYEHMFPPFRMDDLNKMILKKFGKSK